MTLGRGFRGHQLLGLLLLARDGLKIIFRENVAMTPFSGCRDRRDRGLGSWYNTDSGDMSPQSR